MPQSKKRGGARAHRKKIENRNKERRKHRGLVAYRLIPFLGFFYILLLNVLLSLQKKQCNQNFLQNQSPH